MNFVIIAKEIILIFCHTLSNKKITQICHMISIAIM